MAKSTSLVQSNFKICKQVVEFSEFTNNFEHGQVVLIQIFLLVCLKQMTTVVFQVDLKNLIYQISNSKFTKNMLKHMLENEDNKDDSVASTESNSPPKM